MICTQGISAGKPSHLAARYSRQQQMVDETERIIMDARRAEVASWEREWVADGTLPEMGRLYQAFDQTDRPVGEPADFVSAMMRVWSNSWAKEPAGHIEIVKPATGAATEIDSI
jgi:hypothetical protein